MRIVCIAIGLSLSLSNLALSQASGAVDSVVLKRKEDLCLGCQPIADVIVRRREVPDWMLDTIDKRAESSGFYRLSDLRGVPWCEVMMSDQLSATLSIYRGRALTTVRGYHHCIGRLNDTSDVRPPEKQRLLDLEGLIDSVASRKGRFR